MTLKERRAIFVYEAARLENVAAHRPIQPEPWTRRPVAFRANMMRAVARQCGSHRLSGPEQLHAAWVQAYRRMGWRYGTRRNATLKTHPDLVPFAQLGRLEQEKDWVFFMLCEIARRIRP